MIIFNMSIYSQIEFKLNIFVISICPSPWGRQKWLRRWWLGVRAWLSFLVKILYCSYVSLLVYIKERNVTFGHEGGINLIDWLRCHIRWIERSVLRLEYHVEDKHGDWLIFSSLLNRCLYLKCVEKIWMLMLNLVSILICFSK